VFTKVDLSSRSRAPLTALVVLAVLAWSGFASAQTTQEKTAPAPKAPPAQQPAPGQQPPPAAPPAQAWSVDCADADQGLACKAVQSIVLAETRQLLLSVAVSKPEGNTGAAMLLHLPLGLFNPAGATMGIDETAPETLQIQTCDNQGCYAGAALTPEKLAAMSKGTKLNVTFQDLKKQKIVVPVPLKGFEAAFKKL
jgi:invasion protein IalB